MLQPIEQPGGALSRSGSKARGPKTARADAGFTFAELAFGLVIFVIIAVVLANHLSVNYSATRTQRDSVFAYGKAQSILAEIQAYVDRGAVQAAIDLDAMDDGVVNKPALTITQSGGALVPPDHAISGNYQRENAWVWSRRISVQRFPGLNNRNVRFVTVQVFKRDPGGNEHPMASISSVVNSVGSAFPTTQVYDLYLLACENIPGWWVFMESIVPFVESAITDLEARNPGLSIRTHWITKPSYGRSQMYQPYINVAADSTANIPWVYYYPGRMPAGSASQYYYVPFGMKGRMMADGVATNGYDGVVNPMPYAYADWFNNAMRLPQEREFHDARVALIRARQTEIDDARRAGTTPPAPYTDMSQEPTLRLLLEDMCTAPDTYRNAWVINLHGELLPMPALRNYSDAAKAGTRLPNVRVVAHPEELRTQRGSPIDPVRLRVYSYTTDLQYVTNRNAYMLDGSKPKIMPRDMPIAIQIPDLDLTVSGSTNGLVPGVLIEGITGGTNRTHSAPLTLPPYSTGFVTIPARHTLSATDQDNLMNYESSFVSDATGRYTLIKLYNSPVVTPWAEGPTAGQWRGVPNHERGKLYGLDYVPSSPGATTDFARTLATVGAAGDTAPRNTARWRITIPGTVFSTSRFLTPTGSYTNPNADVRLTFKTRIWSQALGVSTGTAFPAPIEPDNLSETYTWWADAREDVPMTERSQFLGDPRLNPYRDLLNGDEFGNGYNWYHDALNNGGEPAAGDFAGIDGGVLRNGWLGRLRADLPRCFELLRTALVSANAVYTTLTGFSYYYVGFGNEIGSDAANGYPSSIFTNMQPWGWGPGSWSNINTITWFRSLPRDGWSYAVPWVGMPWLGELYPDRVAAAWLASGNLSAASSSDFFQNHDQWVYQNSPWTAYGTALQPAVQITAGEGCTSFFNIGTSASTFHHHFWDGTSTLVGAGLDLGSRFNFPMPVSAPSNRPFRIDTNFHGGVGSEWDLEPYRSNRFSARLAKTYYNHPASGATGSGLVELRNPGNTASAYVVVNGISNAVASGSSFIAKYSVLTMVQSFLEGTDPTMSHGITQVPRVEIESPTEITELPDPSSIDIRFGVTWRRWDGLTYTSATPAGFTQPESDLDYVVMYTRDNGTNWLICNLEVPATPGQRPTNPAHIRADLGAGAETFAWSVPAGSFPQGTYVVRVECYRRGMSLHYAQHQVRIFINR